MGKPQLQDYAHSIFPDEQAVGLVQTAATADMGKTVNAKWQHRCSVEYLLGTREKTLLFLVKEICSPLYSEIKHLHPDAARSFRAENVVYSRIHLASKLRFSEFITCLFIVIPDSQERLEPGIQIGSNLHL